MSSFTVRISAIVLELAVDMFYNRYAYVSRSAFRRFVQKKKSILQCHFIAVDPKLSSFNSVFHNYSNKQCSFVAVVAISIGQCQHEIGDLIVEIILQYKIAILVLENNARMISSWKLSFVGPISRASWEFWNKMGIFLDQAYHHPKAVIDLAKTETSFGFGFCSVNRLHQTVSVGRQD